MRPLILLLFSFSYLVMAGQESKLDPIIEKGIELKEEFFSTEIDTNYIETYDLFTVKISAQARFNSIGLYEGRLGNRIQYIPDLGITLGIGGATKSFSFDINTQLGFSQNQISSRNYTDIQFRLFTVQHYLRLRYQYYLGYRLIYDEGNRTVDLADQKERKDLRTMQIGMQYLYSINSDKFSIKAPFALNERQKRNAGSMVAGFEFVLFTMNADSSIVPRTLEYEQSSWNEFSDMSLVLLSANIGYMYSFVIKKNFFFTTSIIPGVGIKTGDYRQEEREVISRAAFWRINSMNAIGYNGKRFACGFQFNLGYNYLPLERNLTANLFDGRGSLYFGYRI